MMRFLLLLLLIGCAVTTWAQPATPYSIEQVVSAPYCANLTAGRNRVAWVVTTEGVRNICVYEFLEASGNVPRAQPTQPGKLIQLTRQTVDDGQELGELRFSPDGRYLAYVRGGSKNAKGENPNPVSDPAGTEQAVYLVPTDGSSTARKIGLGNHPSFSPDGGRLLFSQAGQPVVASLTAQSAGGSVTAAPAVSKLFTSRGSLGSFSWSPDGTRVLFVSDRGYHSFIGVYDLAQKTISWLAPGVDRDAAPVWSPDGKRVAFIRVPGLRHGELENVQGGNRFAIWTADVKTGEGRQLWHSPADDGGFAQYYPAEPLRWTVANQLLFFSEHEDWMHLYSLSPEGGYKPVDRTPGPYEAEETVVSPDGQTLYFSSNNPENDPLDRDRRHVWRVSLTEKNPKPVSVTKGKGIETDPTLVGNWLVCRSAAYNRPTGIEMRSLSQSLEPIRYPSSLPARFPQGALVEPQQVVMTAADGVVVHGQLFLPTGVTSAGSRKPALIFMHGGPMRQMLLGWHYRGTYYANAYAINQYLASQGYVVLSVNYRAGIGYGRTFRRAERQGPRGASEYQDVLAAADYLKSRSDVDAARIGLWGGSYGGYLTALGLARNSDRFAAGVDLHGVHDWSWRGNHFTPGGEWGIGPDQMKEALASSPNADLSQWRSPCLFVHGDDDRNVSFNETVDLVQKLRERQVPTEVLIFPDDVHSLLLHKNWLRTYNALDAFFNKYLLRQPDKGVATEK
ncbi:prolyl oligopeptidase family serine peptidase [Spirosoma sp. 209]|uniref:S9 family peptidase n=1 Tax=Spirosoma sp. 209 TaxID=1955701 RepID=UPI0011170096|nr:prolyl oligopeptidase family serine peptidase [Spirosoma sp. 209]